LANTSEGNLIKVRNEAEAEKTRILLTAQGQAEATRLQAVAQAEALHVIATALGQPGGEDAARLALARDYVAMYGEMGKQSNTILFNDRPADVSSLMVQAMTAMKAVGGPEPPTTAVNVGVDRSSVDKAAAIETDVISKKQ
jgi:regulator of protease activity HflC (stomatin/prohibitin superfamily)